MKFNVIHPFPDQKATATLHVSITVELDADDDSDVFFDTDDTFNHVGKCSFFILSVYIKQRREKRDKRFNSKQVCEQKQLKFGFQKLWNIRTWVSLVSSADSARFSARNF